MSYTINLMVWHNSVSRGFISSPIQAHLAAQRGSIPIGICDGTDLFLLAPHFNASLLFKLNAIKDFFDWPEVRFQSCSLGRTLAQLHPTSSERILPSSRSKSSQSPPESRSGHDYKARGINISKGVAVDVAAVI